MATATLVSFTERPLETAMWAFRNMHNEITSEIENFNSEDQKNTFIDILHDIPHQTVLEFIQTIWLINGSRALQQQLTRSRNAAYSIQSLRVVDVGSFASELNYHEPDGIGKDRIDYGKFMMKIQNEYNQMIESGLPVEVARGILPLNINSPITMTITMRDLLHMLELRMCKNTQGEFRDIAHQMQREISKKIDPYFAKKMIAPPCKRLGFCNSPAPCDMVPSIYPKAINQDVSKIGLVVK